MTGKLGSLLSCGMNIGERNRLDMVEGKGVAIGYSKYKASIYIYIEQILSYLKIRIFKRIGLNGYLIYRDTIIL